MFPSPCILSIDQLNQLLVPFGKPNGYRCSDGWPDGWMDSWMDLAGLCVWLMVHEPLARYGL